MGEIRREGLQRGFRKFGGRLMDVFLNGCLPYFDCDNAVTGVYICPSSLNYIPEICAVYDMSFIFKCSC